ncbi:TonB-dependent receptor [Brevundimonas sp. Leaf363]|uniref:TonB-dependent receptor family protein n=1 Tax=Brevundimonas sp. Leaf363 TaxID=1736353 RepID=UPI0006FBBE68|nr:TonB-dependent receptor [Brevundimonas sp. Leaf363]KQS56035.1 TonB-dependent receptor [Brevundimonas sp. Leaf363]
MSFMTSAAPCALLLAALANPAVAQEAASVAELDSVIVTGPRISDDPAVVADARQRLSRTPGAVAVVSSESYEDRYALALSDTLRSVPGVFAQRRWGEEVRLSIRGSGIGQGAHMRGVLLAQDGVPINAADGFGEFQELDPLIARYTEVYKGGNALRFGGAMLGGAINVVTPTGRNVPYNNLLRIEGGSFQTRRLHAALARQSGDWDLYAAATWSGSDGFRDQQDADSERMTVSLGRQLGDDREVRLIVQGNALDQDISAGATLNDALHNPRATTPAAAFLNYGRNVDSIRTSLQTHWRFNDNLVFEGGVYASDRGLYHPVPVVLDNHYRTYGGFGRFDWTGQIAGLRADAFAGAYFRTGDTDAEVFLNTGGGVRGFKIGDTLQQASGLDVFAEGRLFVTEHVALIGGGSWGRAERDLDNHLNPTNDAETRYDWLAPRIGLLWEGDGGSQIYANVTRSVEPPSFYDLVQSPVPQFVPLDEQKAWTAEVGARGQHGPFRYDISAYRAELTGELLNYVVTADIPAATFNAGDTVHQGIEAGLDWRLMEEEWGRLTLRQISTWSDFRFDGDAVYGDNRLPILPEHAYRAELKYEHPAGWFVAPSIEWVPRDVYVDYANRVKYPGYATASLNAGIDLTDTVAVFADLRNLTDEKYVSNAGAVVDGVTGAQDVYNPGEGRSAFVGVRVAW